MSEVNHPKLSHYIDLAAMQDSAAGACNLMKVMANPDRLLLLCQISQGEKAVGELGSCWAYISPRFRSS